MSDFITRQRGGAIGARLRRASERIDRDALVVYEDAGIAFEQRWMGVLRILSEVGPTSVSVIAAELGISHPSVSEARRSLLEAGIVREVPDPVDGRRRALHLTAKGSRLLRKVRPLWSALIEAGEELAREAPGLVEALDRLDAALDRESLAERALRLSRRRAPSR